MEVQAPQVRDRGLPSAAVKITSGLSSALALRRASVTLVSQGISRQGLSPCCGLMAASSRSKSAAGILYPDAQPTERSGDDQAECVRQRVAVTALPRAPVIARLGRGTDAQMGS